MRFHYTIHDKSYTVDVEQDGRHYRVTIDGRTYEVTGGVRDEGRVHLNRDGRRLRAYVARDGDRRHVALNGRTYVLERSRGRRRSRSARAEAAQGSLEAQMPGQVVAVLVEAGEKVAAGQPLVLLEAMKMELRVVAPYAGRVQAVRCREGDVVERGAQLVVLEPAEIE